MKANDNIMLWYTSSYQFIRNSSLSAIVLNPDLAILNIKMYHTSIDSPFARPTDMN